MLGCMGACCSQVTSCLYFNSITLFALPLILIPNPFLRQGIPAGDNSPAFDTHVLGLQAHTVQWYCAVLGMSPGFRACQVNILLFEQQPSIPSGHVLFLPQGLSLSLHCSPLLRAELRIYG